MMTAGMILKTARQAQQANEARTRERKRIEAVLAAKGRHYDPYRNYLQDDDASAELAVAIVKEAARHYESVLMRLLDNPAGKQRRDLLAGKADDEAFFLSPDFEAYMPHTDGRAFMKQIQKNAVEKKKQKARERLEKARKEAEQELKKGWDHGRI